MVAAFQLDYVTRTGRLQRWDLNGNVLATYSIGTFSGDSLGGSGPPATMLIDAKGDAIVAAYDTIKCVAPNGTIRWSYSYGGGRVFAGGLGIGRGGEVWSLWSTGGVDTTRVVVLR